MITTDTPPCTTCGCIMLKVEGGIACPNLGCVAKGKVFILAPLGGCIHAVMLDEPRPGFERCAFGDHYVPVPVPDLESYDLLEDAPPAEPATTGEACPKCGSKDTVWGYGLAGGGMGSYIVCSDCAHIFGQKQDG